MSDKCAKAGKKQGVPPARQQVNAKKRVERDSKAKAAAELKWARRIALGKPARGEARAKARATGV